MNKDTMESTVKALITPDKGILAADESLPTIEKRFKQIHISSTEENRLAYREMLFTTPELNRFISGVILFDETIRQKDRVGIFLAEALAKQGIIPGIKVDKGTVALAGFTGEKITEGLDGLRDRLTEYRKLGARFTKWRAVITIGENIPTDTCIVANADTLARFAALSQEAGLAPIVEPEVLMDGDHPIERCEGVTTLVLKSVFSALSAHHVTLEQMLLKTGMVLSGKDCLTQADNQEIAERTLRCLRRVVPPALSGIVFLSGGQSDEAATRRLSAICNAGEVPWKLSFSFGRALQDPPMGVWKGLPDNVRKAQHALHECAQRNSLALHDSKAESI